jgi:hypothetical protein
MMDLQIVQNQEHFPLRSADQTLHEADQPLLVHGVRIEHKTNLMMDEAFTTGLLAKTGLATFTPIMEDEDSGVSKYFAVTRVLKGGKAGDRYELLSNRFKLEMVDADRLKALL